MGSLQAGLRIVRSMHVMIKRPAVSEEVVMDLRGRGVEVSSARLLDTVPCSHAFVYACGVDKALCVPLVTISTTANSARW